MGAYAFSYSVPKTYDQRMGIEGGMGGGTLIGPEANYASPGSVATRVGDFSTMNQTLTGNKFKVGMSGQEVRELLTQQGSLATDQLGRVTDFGKAAMAAVQAGRAQDQGTALDWKQLLPLGVVAIIVLAALRRRS